MRKLIAFLVVAVVCLMAMGCAPVTYGYLKVVEYDSEKGAGWMQSVVFEGDSATIGCRAGEHEYEFTIGKGDYISGSLFHSARIRVTGSWANAYGYSSELGLTELQLKDGTIIEFEGNLFIAADSARKAL